MPYDKNLDQEIFSEGADFGDSKITVSVFSYNKGEPKLQISRQVRRAQEDWIFAKLGRLNKAEIGVVMPLIQKAIEKM